MTHVLIGRPSWLDGGMFHLFTRCPRFTGRVTASQPIREEDIKDLCPNCLRMQGGHFFAA